MTPKNMNAAEFTRFCKLHGACKEGLAWIKGKSLDEFWRTSTRGDWMLWWLDASQYAWTAPARQAYDEAVTPAWQAYDEAVAPAWQAYEEAIAPAWQAYQEAV